MIITPGMSMILLVVYGAHRLWKKQPISREDFLFFAFICTFFSILVILGINYGQKPQIPEDLKTIMKNVIASKSEDSIISSLEALNHKSNVFNTKLEKREEINWVLRFLVWPIHRPWSHVHGSDTMNKYEAQWKLGDTYYQATIVLRDDK